MTPQLLFDSITFGFSISGILLLVSLGISIGFGLMRIVNMEQMIYYTFGAYMTYTLVAASGSFLLGAACGVLVAAFLGFIVERMLLRRVYGEELMFTMVVTFSVFLIGIGIVQYIWGLAPKPVTSPTEIMISIFSVSMPLYRLIVIGVAALIYIGIQLLLNKTIIGKALRAGIEDPENVQGLGINIYKIITFTFVVASGLAGLGGALNAPLIMIGPYMGFDMLLFAFVTVVLGGLGSIKGTLVSALILGQMISVGAAIWSPLSYLAPFVLMFFFLLIKPSGLYGVAGKAFGFEE
jgi:branched-subunit amino acid ABC-type transport system permease component